MSVQTVPQRYSKMVRAALSELVTDDDHVVFGVAMTEEEFACAEEEDVFHVSAALTIAVSVCSDDCPIVLIARISIPWNHQPTNEDVRAMVGTAWVEITFRRLVADMEELEDSLDAIAEGEDND